MTRLGAHVGGKYIPAFHIFRREIGLTPSPFHLFVDFGQDFPAKSVEAIAKAGAIPFVTLRCDDVARVASGSHDAFYAKFFREVAAYGRLVYLRTFHEMNTEDIHSCGTQAQPALFVTAWRRIVGIARDEGATNAKMVWCPSARVNPAALDPYYPGKAWVDVIGVDEYANNTDGSYKDAMLWPACLEHYLGEGLPLMLVETAAVQADQEQYITWLQETIKARPWLDAVMWWDEPGGPSSSHPGFTWNLGTPGARAFRMLYAALWAKPSNLLDPAV